MIAECVELMGYRSSNQKKSGIISDLSIIEKKTISPRTATWCVTGVSNRWKGAIRDN